MTKILSLLLMLGAGIMTHAQIKKDAVLLGGQLSYNRTSNISYVSIPVRANQSAETSISAGKAIKENTVFGLIASYASSRMNTPYSNGTGAAVYADTKQKRINAGVFYRKYRQLIKDLYFFGEGSLTYNGFYQKETIPGSGTHSTSTEHGGQLSITPGISYNIFKKLQAELLIPSIFSTRYSRTSDGQNRFAIFTGLQNTNLGYLGVGFHVIL